MPRPRAFDQEKVLDQIMKLFWKKGFRGTSMDDLVQATGVNKGSLYHGFGKKEDLFKLALNRYLGQGAAALPRKSTAIATLCQYYAYIVAEAAHRSPSECHGCFVFNSCLEFGNQDDALAQFVLTVGKKREMFFRSVLQEAKDNAEIPTDVDVNSAAQRAFATAFTIREMSKFKPEADFLTDLANSFLVSIGAKGRLTLKGSRYEA